MPRKLIIANYNTLSTIPPILNLLCMRLICLSGESRFDCCRTSEHGDCCCDYGRV